MFSLRCVVIEILSTQRALHIDIDITLPCCSVLPDLKCIFFTNHSHQWLLTYNQLHRLKSWLLLFLLSILCCVFSSSLLLFISAKWTEWNWQIFCFHFCLSICVCALIWMGRNVFDSCMKSWEYFRTDGISLESMFHWLFDDLVRFKIEVGVEEKCTKM